MFARQNDNEEDVLTFRRTQAMECYEALVTETGEFYAGDMVLLKDIFPEVVHAMFL